jgi:primosomal protein N' (replication factor Y)
VIVAVFHSKYNNNERIEVWNQVLKKSDKAQVIIGARSALFLPFQNSRLLIVDEEHDKLLNKLILHHVIMLAAIVLAQAHKAKSY